MRIPLARSGGDNKPIAWWEWLFSPIMMPLFVLVLLVMAAVSGPVESNYRQRQRREEQQLLSRLASAGRVIEWAEVDAKLEAGQGTLIIGHCSPKGPIREWWVEDDLIALAPLPLPSSVTSLHEGTWLLSRHKYARACFVRYLDRSTGSAKLTEVPVPPESQFDPGRYTVVNLGDGLMTAIMLIRGRMLSGKYPHGKVVTLVEWLDGPLLFIGDAESVFYPPPSTTPQRPSRHPFVRL